MIRSTTSPGLHDDVIDENQENQSSFLNTVKQGLNDTLDAVKSGAEKVLETTKSGAKYTLNAAKSGADFVGGSVMEGAETVGSGLKNVGDTIADTVIGQRSEVDEEAAVAAAKKEEQEVVKKERGLKQLLLHARKKFLDRGIEGSIEIYTSLTVFTHTITCQITKDTPLIHEEHKSAAEAAEEVKLHEEISRSSQSAISAMDGLIRVLEQRAAGYRHSSFKDDMVLSSGIYVTVPIIGVASISVKFAATVKSLLVSRAAREVWRHGKKKITSVSSNQNNVPTLGSSSVLDSEKHGPSRDVAQFDQQLINTGSSGLTQPLLNEESSGYLSDEESAVQSRHMEDLPISNVIGDRMTPKDTTIPVGEHLTRNDPDQHSRQHREAAEVELDAIQQSLLI